MVNNQNSEGRNDGKTVLEQSSDVTFRILSIAVGLSFLKLILSSLFLYGVMKKKAIIIQIYIIFTYVLLVINIILQILLINNYVEDKIGINGGSTKICISV